MYTKQPNTVSKWLLAHFHTALSGTMKTTHNLNGKTDLLLSVPSLKLNSSVPKNIPNPRADLTKRWRSGSVNKNLSRAPSPVLSISLLFGFVCHPQPSKPPADWERASLPQLVFWAPCLPSILPFRSQASYKGGMNYGLVQPRGCFFWCCCVFSHLGLTLPNPVCTDRFSFPRPSRPRQKLLFPTIDFSLLLQRTQQIRKLLWRLLTRCQTALFHWMWCLWGSRSRSR